MAAMLSVALARALAAAGVLWQPQPGDRFVIDEEQLIGDVFWISDLTIELHHYGDASVLGFNGTTEWALDSVDLGRTLWLPREDQLRELLGDRLVALHRDGDRWRVVARHVGGASDATHATDSADGTDATHATHATDATDAASAPADVEITDPDVEIAYATALLTLIGG